ncbi:hypothetical protein [Micromonospora taraxaci]|uniref:hypothetical protein n=1 Tax=Micromonospora taraxaci TaxID=1316803 RepID=UPI003C2F288C
MKRWQFRVEIYAGTLGWVDITDDVRGGLSITRGRSGEGYRADPGKCGFRLDNRSGRYSPRNPLSDLYGLIGKNTLIRVSAGPIGGSLVGRFFGEVPSWPPRWSLSGKDRYVDVDAAGVLRRFRQGDQPVLSPMRRTIEASSPVAYWPGEDGVLSGQAGGATSGLSPLTATGAVEFKPVENYVFATSATVFGTTALADLAAGGRLAAQLPSDATAATAGGPWTVHAAILVDTLSTLSGDVVLLEWTTNGGTYTRWQVKVTTTSRTQLIGITSGGSSTLLIDHPNAAPTFHHYAASASVSGGTVTVRLVTSNSVNLTTTFAGSLGGVASVAVNATSVTSSTSMPAGHVAVWAAAPIPVAIQGVTDAYGVFVRESRRSNLGEAAVDRLIRLAAETGLDLDATPADPGHVSRMNVQLAASTTSAIDDAIAIDGGMLYEARDSGALAYRTRSELYNQAPVAISYVGQTTEPFDPTDDVDDVRNDITVERRNGSSARAVKLDGPLAAKQPPAGIGVYPSAPTLNLLDDSQLADLAGWMLHLGTVDEPRYPAITVQLAAPDWVSAPTLRAQLLALDVGDVLEVTGPPAWVSGRVRTLVTGYSESIDEFLWSITFNGVPASPWDVATADGEQRAAADGSALGVALGASDMTAVITSTPENGPWTQDPADFPLPIRVGGEQVTASAIGPVLAETFTRTGSDGWGNPDAGPAWVVAPAPGQFAVGGGEGLIGINATNTTFTATVAGVGPDLDVVVRLRADAVAVGGFYQQVVRYRVGAGYVESVIRYKTTGQIDLLLQTQSTVLAAVGNVLPYGAGTPFRLRIQATGATVRHVLYPAAASEPGWSATTSSAPTFGDGFALAGFRESSNTQSGLAVAFDSVTFRTPQLATLSARGVNGAQRAWPAGTEVDVWQPAIAAL